jgi:hypothetical protein
MVRSLAVIVITFVNLGVAAPEFEYCNNFLMNYSFLTGNDRGMAQNLDDNLSWMAGQGYTHLRFFGIFPNGVHCFPSPTLNANGWPGSAYHEQVLPLLLQKAEQHGIVVNFDGWEIIAESNYDTTVLGVNFISEEELATVVQEVLSYGCGLISEEQFGSTYLQAIQSVTATMGAIHETTAALWYQSGQATSIADAQLASVFCFYPRELSEADSIIAAGQGYDIPATLGGVHTFLESAKYFDVPVSLAVGTFGTMETENWKNVLIFSQWLHHLQRVSIEDSNHDFLISPSFNFGSYVGDELTAINAEVLDQRPVANLVLDIRAVHQDSFIPTWFASRVNLSAIVNTFTVKGFRVVTTVDSVLPDATAYYLLLTGGSDETTVAPLPEYVLPLLADTIPWFIQPVLGIPDHTDAEDWLPLRDHFGLPPMETQTAANAIPEIVTYNGFTTRWGGIALYLTPALELIPASTIDDGIASVVLTGEVSEQEIALLIQNGNSWLINTNVFHHEASYVLSHMLDGALNRPTGADVVITEDMGLVFAEYDTDIDIDIPWNEETHVRKYDSQGNITVDILTDLDGTLSATMARGELYVLRREMAGCCVGITGNVDADEGERVDIGDLTALVAYLYIPPNPESVCMQEGNIDGDTGGLVDIGDLTALIAYLYIPPNPAPAPCQ